MKDWPESILVAVGSLSIHLPPYYQTSWRGPCYNCKKETILSLSGLSEITKIIDDEDELESFRVLCDECGPERIEQMRAQKKEIDFLFGSPNTHEQS